MARREHRQVDDAWLNLLLLLIGDHVETEVVTGAVVSVRKAGDKLALWIKEADELETVVKVVFMDNRGGRWTSLDASFARCFGIF